MTLRKKGRWRRFETAASQVRSGRRNSTYEFCLWFPHKGQVETAGPSTTLRSGWDGTIGLSARMLVPK